MKIASPDILHKTDVGGVRLDLRSPNDVRDSFDLMVYRAGRYVPGAQIWGCQVQQMVSGGREILLGMSRDPQFGPVIMFGLGGIFVEVLKDVSFRVAPLADEDIDDMIQEIKGYRILTGIRGEKPTDIPAIKNIIVRVSEIAVDNPEIQEIDLNPVIVHEKGASIVDSRIILTT